MAMHYANIMVATSIKLFKKRHKKDQIMIPFDTCHVFQGFWGYMKGFGKNKQTEM